MDDLLKNGNRISEVNETTFLGVIIDNKLNWSPHVMHISKKIAKGIGIILKARKVAMKHFSPCTIHYLSIPQLLYPCMGLRI